MNENQVSMTALINTFARAYHSANQNPKIFDDFLAHTFFTEAEYNKMETDLAGSLKFFYPEKADNYTDKKDAVDFVIKKMFTQTLCRSKFTEDELFKSIENGVKQYIILGSGLDTFAFRNSEVLIKIKVFDIDHQSTQNFKLERINQLDWKINKNLCFVPVDFSKENIFTALDSYSYNQNLLSFFSWLGVTFYLTRDTVFSTLENIAKSSISGSTIIFDYIDVKAFNDNQSSNVTRLVREVVSRIGEPMQAGLNPLTLEADLKNFGLQLEENLSPKVIKARYFNGLSNDYSVAEHMYYARATVI